MNFFSFEFFLFFLTISHFNSSRVTNLVCLDTLGEEGMMYQPGDHLYIYPENSEDHVNKLLQRIKCTFNKDDIVTVEQTTGGTLFWFAVVLFFFFQMCKSVFKGWT